jgi:hypothetical protein
VLADHFVDKVLQFPGLFEPGLVPNRLKHVFVVHFALEGLAGTLTINVLKSTNRHAFVPQDRLNHQHVADGIANVNVADLQERDQLLARCLLELALEQLH